MPTQRERGFTLVDVLAAVFIIGILSALLWPAVQWSRENKRRAACVDNMKQLGLALHNFHDARKAFPGATNTSWADDPAFVASGPWGVPPEPASPAFDGNGDGRVDRGNGWSWTVMIRPYMDESLPYKRLRINDTSNSSVLAMPWNGSAGPGANECRYTTQAMWDIQKERVDPGRQLPPWQQFPLFRCPSFSGGDTVDPPEGLDAYGPYDPSNPKHKPVAISNYACLGASHFPSLLKNARLNTPAPGTPEEDDISYEGTGKANALSHPNGTMYPGSRNGIRDIKDGLSNTILLCETREESYSAWFDGAVGCLVGLVSPETGPSLEGPPADSFIPAPGVEPPYGNVATTGPNAVETYLNFGEQYDKTGKRFYIHYKTGNRIHGPSSEHPGVVNHLFADGHVNSIEDGIDANVYFHLITRRGSEPVEEFFEEL